MQSPLGQLIDWLGEDHATLWPLLDRLEQAALGHELTAVVDEARAVLDAELDAHIAAEDADLFPALREPLGEGVVAVFESEHREIQSLRDRLLASGDAAEAAGVAIALCDLLRSHTTREEAMLFPSARRHLEDD